jgi:ribose 5-phosphate isomerase A
MSEAKRLAGEKAIEYVEDGMIVGVGTGSTVAITSSTGWPSVKGTASTGAVASSEQSTARAAQASTAFEVMDLNSHRRPAAVRRRRRRMPPNYLHLIKGGGGALTREKIVAAASETKFVCIIDDGETRGRCWAGFRCRWK